MRILALCGSLRAESINAAVLEAAALLAPAALTIVQYGGLAELPIFNPISTRILRPIRCGGARKMSAFPTAC